jgi:hypothetical protein
VAECQTPPRRLPESLPCRKARRLLFPDPVTQLNSIRGAVYLCTVAWAVFGALELRGTETNDDMREQLKQLQLQNRALQEQLQRQQVLIESLTSKVNDMQTAQTQSRPESPNVEPAVNDAAVATKGGGTFGVDKVSISGEGAVGFLATGSEGMYPHPQFRLDEARLFIESPVWGQVYFYSQLDMATPEEQDVQVRLGETYVDFENVSQLWNCDRVLNVRFGRIFIPYGEEYLSRFAIDNPLISRSLTDIWGVNAGLELYGTIGNFCYVVAAQDGGLPDTTDGEADKSVAGRIGYDPTHWLHLSVSAMRTGSLDVAQDGFSAMWFANGFLRSIGSSATTTFHANLVEGDVVVALPHGHLKTFGGYLNYNDNNPAGGDQRDVYYYAVEAVHDITPKLYAGARFSEIFANQGFPLTGYGSFDDYFLNTLSTELWRLSLGLGYRFSPNLVFKAEYSLERGRELDGEKRDHEDFAAFEAAFRF